jgi:EAL and modified HD-GYP domain-containing signal transduction protein
LIKQIPNIGRDREIGERAFIAGVLSLVDALFGATMEEIIAPLNLTDDVRMALLDRQGLMGILLQIAEEMEKADFTAAEVLLGQIQLTTAQLAEAQLETIAWSKGLAEYAPR